MFFDNHVLLEMEKATFTSWSFSDFNMVLAIATDLPRILLIGEEGNIMTDYEIKRGKNTVS